MDSEPVKGAKGKRFWYGVAEVAAVPQFLSHTHTRVDKNSGQDATRATRATLSDSDTPDREVF